MLKKANIRKSGSTLFGPHNALQVYECSLEKLTHEGKYIKAYTIVDGYTYARIKIKMIGIDIAHATV